MRLEWRSLLKWVAANKKRAVGNGLVYLTTAVVVIACTIAMIEVSWWTPLVVWGLLAALITGLILSLSS